MLTIETITPEQATERLRAMGMKMSKDRLVLGIEQGVYPFGECVQMGKGRALTVYEKLFNDWVSERAIEKEETT